MSENLQYNPEAQVLFSLISANKSRTDILSKVSTEDFTNTYQMAYNDIKKAINEDFIDSTDFNDSFFMKYPFITGQINSNRWQQAVKEMINRSIRRKVNLKCLMLQNIVMDENTSIKDINELIDQIKNDSDDVRISDKKIFSMKDFVAAGLNKMQEIQSGNDVYLGWGIDELSSIAPMVEGDLTIIAARPGQGKTILAHNCILGSQKQHNTAYWCSEMPDFMIAWRCLSAHSGVKLKDIQKQELSHGQMEDLQKSIAAFGGMQNSLFMSTGENKRKGDTVEDICRWIKKLVIEKNVKVVFLDYLQRIKATNYRQARHDQIRHIALALKQCAMDLKISIVALTQLNREAAKVRPSLHHLAECSFIEQEASVVVLADRIEPDQDARIKNYKVRVAGTQNEYKTLTTQDLQGKIILNIVKNRNNPTGIIYLDIDMETLKIGQRAKFNNGYFSG
ncbi:MAG: DnaB-like helicase C-terminal domain-containing protein [Desulfobulbia bacterium]